MTRPPEGATSLLRRLVFISHSGLDTWGAVPIARAVGAVGVDTFLDEVEVEVGADFAEEIRGW